MLSRIYLLVGIIVLLGYVVVSYRGWEFGSTKQSRPSPYSGRSSSGGSRGSWWIITGAK